MRPGEGIAAMSRRYFRNAFSHTARSRRGSRKTRASLPDAPNSPKSFSPSAWMSDRGRAHVETQGTAARR
jgi:hypothetical protein